MEIVVALRLLSNKWCKEKGTAKSTLIRGAAELADGMKITELPLNVTEDRLVGSIDLKQALQNGRRELEPGILDTENDFIKFHLCQKLNDKLRGTLLTMEKLRADGIVEAIARFK